jgi:hypothetical protein
MPWMLCDPLAMSIYISSLFCNAEVTSSPGMGYLFTRLRVAPAASQNISGPSYKIYQDRFPIL